MSWHYLQGQEEASWEGQSLDGAPSALLSLMPTPGASCSPGNATGACLDSQSGTTCEPSTGDHGEAPLTSCQEDSHARTFPAPDAGPESRVSEADCGGAWRELSARFDLVASGWRTHRCLFDEALPWSSVTLPRWGMMRGGVLWERATPGLHTSGTGFGCWLPTPKSRDWKGQSQRGIHGPMDALPNIDRGDGTPIGGQLNPPWVEWLMGWPIGWTDCDASATDKPPRPWPWRGTSSRET
jgi:hypothetical protein